ncbi:MAG: LL-diaminopimelate aminotransferase [Proteobacteria bacterium]|nr:LL-diaminopimelate aminotransferase [Pseudomonadota bacterium]
MAKARRIEELPPYLFAEIDRKKEEMRKKGIDIIDLGIGDPDPPTPARIVEAMRESIGDASTHRYPSYRGMPEFRQAVALWYRRRFDVDIDPTSEVLILIGSKEGIAHIPLAFVDPGDVVLVPSPGYPVYRVATLFAGGEPYFMPLLKEKRFLADFSEIPPPVCQRAKLLFINYPNNPTGAVADYEFFEKVVEFALENEIIVCHDAAYTEIAYEGYRTSSFLEVAGAKEVGVEFHSLSKTCNMTGWRVGFAVGNAEVIEGLGKIKTNVDSGVFQAVQLAGVDALEHYDEEHRQILDVYQRRRDLMVEALWEAGLELEKPLATFYLWITVPEGYTSAEFTTLLLTEAGIVATPGNGFGEWGEGYVRMSLTISEERLQEAARRLKEINFRPGKKSGVRSQESER